jgi:catechol 2,3-dioxygenase-like lactoylglutathione lyase family enzyme
MKRFHVHMHVSDLPKNIAFYSALFDAQPAKHESDYAKWMLEDPPINFAISTRGSATGVDHLGIQVSEAAELGELRARADKADMSMLDSGETTCCYARSDKYWLTDPQGVAWEQFHTLSDVPVFSESRKEIVADSSTACCANVAPATVSVSLASLKSPAKAACC